MKRNTLVMAKMRNGDLFAIAKIIEIRIAFEGANQSPDIQLITTNSESDQVIGFEEIKVENAEERPEQ